MTTKNKKVQSLRCPTCRKIVLAGESEYPFCSDRCRVVDLGKWVSGGYVISTPVHDPESGGETEYHQPSGRPYQAPRHGPTASSEDDDANPGRRPN
jgi:endogenous inhibitor of DNA gyrase (YacG/DUF329 family)